MVTGSWSSWWFENFCANLHYLIDITDLEVLPFLAEVFGNCHWSLGLLVKEMSALGYNKITPNSLITPYYSSHIHLKVRTLVVRWCLKKLINCIMQLTRCDIVCDMSKLYHENWPYGSKFTFKAPRKYFSDKSFYKQVLSKTKSCKTTGCKILTTADY